MQQSERSAYLSRLGITERGAPSAPALARLHEAHVARIPFETLARAHGVDPADSITRITRDGLGGVCYHLNGAFHELLSDLGYQASLHPAGVQSAFAPLPQGPNGTHDVVLVAGLPTRDNPEGRWLCDVGAGEGFHRPLPLRAGAYTRGIFTYRLRQPDPGIPQHWRVDYDARESCTGLDFSTEPARQGDFAAIYERLADEDMCIFFLYGWVKRHDATGFDELIGAQLSRVDAGGRRSEALDSFCRWRAVLRDVFGLDLRGYSRPEAEALWQRMHAVWTSRSFRDDMHPDRSTLV